MVDDSALMRRVLGDILKAREEFEVGFARDGVEALDKLQSFAPDVITLDITMPHMDGLTCLDLILLERPCPVVMVSTLTEAGAEATLEAMRLGAIDFIAKPAGTVSLAIDEFGPLLEEKVRAAAKARPRASLRLAERLRLRTGAERSPQRPVSARTRVKAASAESFDKIVVVGSSTGGPPALDALLLGLPADFPWPVLIAQHMPASFTGALARRLNKLCALTVVEVSDTVALKAGTVHIGRGDADLIVTARGGALLAKSVSSSAEHRWHPSVDRLVSSAMESVDAARLIGVLMTGMGDDGAAAMTRLRQSGGRTIAESEETAVIWGMPGELVRAGGAEVVLPLDKISRQLLAWAR